MITQVIFILIVWVIAWWLCKPNPHSPPYMPGPLPILGHLLKLIGDRKYLWEYIRTAQLFSMEVGGTVEARLGPHSFYVITDPEVTLLVANTCLNKPYFYDFAKDFLNNGLITAEVPVWKVHRKLLNPAFSQQTLNTYINEINLQARNFVSQLAQEVGKDFDPRSHLVKYTMSTVTRTSLKLNDIKDQISIDVDYAAAIDEILALYCDRFQKWWWHLSCLFNWSSMKRRQTKLTYKLQSIMDNIIHKRKSELKVNKDSNLDHDSTQEKFKPVLDQMLHLAEQQQVFTDDDIRQHLDTLVAASYDTTTSAMTFILLAIGKYTDVQERIFNEIQEVLEGKDADITKQDLPKLVYLEAVIKESMRLYPAVPLIGRKIDVEIAQKNYTLRPGSSCIIGVYGLLRHPMWGPDAEQFRPERWLDSANIPTHPSFNAAFGVGKRHCIGKVFSMMMMKIALAHLVRRYYITGDIDKTECRYDVVLKPTKGHHISLKLRN